MESIKLKISLIYLLFSSHGLSAQSPVFLIDPRDQQTYKTITYQIKTKKASKEIVWMAENLNYETQNSYCLNDSTINCHKYGRYYTWYDAMKACPEGWHLPSNEEWQQLADIHGGLAVAGKKLKHSEIVNKKNKVSFNGLLAGARDAVFNQYFKFGSAGFFWSSTEVKTKPDEAYDWSFASWTDQLRRWEGGKFIGNSCRCIKK